MTPSTRPVAAVDLGSNSFHLVVGRVVDGQLHVVDRLRERVALADGLDDESRLRPKAQVRALACLRRFGQRLRDLPPGSVRAVGTNTFRRARQIRAFLTEAQAALGHPIEVISGAEEARLVYLGVVRELPDRGHRPLVVDIGGGSTECVLGEDLEVVDSASLWMGCVSWSRAHFPDGAVTAKRFERARLAARLELEPVERRLRSHGWELCLGSSGTVLAVSALLRESRWSDGEITGKGLRRLKKRLVQAGSAAALDLPGLARDRRPVLAGGLAILAAVFEALRVDVMQPSPTALREGLLHDLVGRIHRSDVRDVTIRRFTERFHVDLDQAARVERTALRCFEAVREAWSLDPERGRQLLIWASRLHEIGLTVSHGGHHRHGAYLVAESEMPGFSREDQAILAALVRGHRRKLRAETFEVVPDNQVEFARRLCVLLRLAVRLNRSRSPRQLPDCGLGAEESAVTLSFPEGWLAAHPLTAADFEEEGRLLAQAGFELRAR